MGRKEQYFGKVCQDIVCKDSVKKDKVEFPLKGEIRRSGLVTPVLKSEDWDKRTTNETKRNAGVLGHLFALWRLNWTGDSLG